MKLYLPSELRSLPTFTIISDKHGIAWQKISQDGFEAWYAAGDSISEVEHEILPAVLVREGLGNV